MSGQQQWDDTVLHVLERTLLVHQTHEYRDPWGSEEGHHAMPLLFPRPLCLGCVWGVFNYSFEGWILFPFSTYPSFDLFWCSAAVNKKYLMLETKCVQFLSQKEGL